MIRNRRFKCLAVFWVLTVCAYTVCALIPPKQNYGFENALIRKNGELPMIIAHRGGDEEFPGNTLEAFYNAYSVDKSIVMETDVNITKDGVLILLHNEQLDKTTNVTGLASDWNYSDLLAQRVDFGYDNPTEDGWLSGEREHYNIDGVNVYPTDVTYPEGIVPRDNEVFLVTTLEDLLIAFPDNYISVEIKQDGELGIAALKEAVRLLEVYDAFDRVTLMSFHTEIHKEMRRMQKDGRVPDGFMYSLGLLGIVKWYVLYKLGLDSLFFNGVGVLQIPIEKYGFRFDEQRLIRIAHEHNIAVQYWTVNDEADMRRLIELGVDGIMTDCPSKLKEVYQDYQ